MALTLRLRVGEAVLIFTKELVGVRQVHDQIAWSTDNAAVAIVSARERGQSAEVRGVGTGSCIITAASGGATETISTTVLAAGAVDTITLFT